MPRADVRHLAQRVDLQRFEIPDVLHILPYRIPPASRINAGIPSPMMVAPLNSGSVPRRVEALYDDLPLAQHSVHHEPGARSPISSTMMGRRGGGASPTTPEQLAQMHERHDPVAQHDRLPALDPSWSARRRTPPFPKRTSTAARTASRRRWRSRAHDREGHRQRSTEARALARLRPDLDRPRAPGGVSSPRRSPRPARHAGHGASPS